jgi:opacity protein-like surface antigen
MFNMKRILYIAIALSVTMIAFTSIRAQSDYNKWEGMAGYSYLNLNRGVDPDELNDNFSDTPFNRVNAHGFNGSIVYNFRRFVGAKFDMTLHTYGADFTSTLTVNPPPPGGNGAGTFKSSQNVYQFMGGIQIKDNDRDGSKVRPFAHILMGVADQSLSVDRTAPVNAQLFKISGTDFAMKFGAGLDVGVSKNVAIRVIQFDWNPIFRGDANLGNNLGTTGGSLQNNWLLTFGVVFH